MSLAALRLPYITNLLKCGFCPRASPKILQRCNLATQEVGKPGKIARCGPPHEPQCGDHFRKSPCELNKGKRKEPKKRLTPTNKTREIVKRNAFCCGNPCIDALPRFDKLYYRRSDKSKRRYQQTWNECPYVPTPQRQLCHSTPIKPKFEKRPPRERPATACKQELCLPAKSKCPQVKMPKCKLGRKPPSCLTQRKPADCTKRKTPYPSFSECTSEKIKKLRAAECNCLNIPSICAVWAFHHKKMAVKKPMSCF